MAAACDVKWGLFETRSLRSLEAIEALYNGGVSAYFVKPIEIKAFVQELTKLGLIKIRLAFKRSVGANFTPPASLFVAG
jgi:response regulator of citrate/malate metabolism